MVKGEASEVPHVQQAGGNKTANFSLKEQIQWHHNGKKFRQSHNLDYSLPEPGLQRVMSIKTLPQE